MDKLDSKKLNFRTPCAPKTSVKKPMSTLKKSCTNKFSDSSLHDEQDNDGNEIYEKEYYIYILRKAQNKIFNKDQVEKKEKLKQCLVLLKAEYEDLLNKNVNLNGDVKKMHHYSKNIADLKSKTITGEKAIQILNQGELEASLKQLTNNLNQLQLVAINKDIISKAFEDHTLGYDSLLFKLLTKLQKEIADHKDVASKIAIEVKEIKQIQSDIEVLRKKCDSVIEELISKGIALNYKTFFNLATHKTEVACSLDSDFGSC